MLTIPIYDTILLPDVTFYFKKEVIEDWNVDELEVGDVIAFAMLRDDIDISDAEEILLPISEVNIPLLDMYIFLALRPGYALLPFITTLSPTDTDAIPTNTASLDMLSVASNPL